MFISVRAEEGDSLVTRLACFSLLCGPAQIFRSAYSSNQNDKRLLQNLITIRTMSIGQEWHFFPSRNLPIENCTAALVLSINLTVRISYSTPVDTSVFIVVFETARCRLSAVKMFESLAIDQKSIDGVNLTPKFVCQVLQHNKKKSKIIN